LEVVAAKIPEEVREVEESVADFLKRLVATFKQEAFKNTVDNTANFMFSLLELLHGILAKHIITFFYSFIRFIINIIST
jgi:hypothetical protein